MDLHNYPLSEMLLFSPEIFARLIASYNAEFWPAHIVFGIIGAALIGLVCFPSWFQGRAVALLLIISWLWTGYIFHFERLSAINWIAYVYAFIFLMQVLRLSWIGLKRDELRFSLKATLSDSFGFIVLLYAIIVYPLITVYQSGLLQIEMFGLLPIPVLIATFGIILMSEEKPKLILLLAPAVASFFEGLTAIAADHYHAVSVLIIAVISVIIITWRSYIKEYA